MWSLQLPVTSLHTAPGMSDQRFAPTIPWVLFLMVMVFFSVFPRLLVSPLLLRISEGYGIGFDVASQLFLTMSAGFVVGLFVSGFIATRISHHWTVTFSVGVAGALLFLASFSPSIVLLHVALTVMGFANGLYPGSGIASVASLVPDVHRGKALAIHESGPNFAFILAPIAAAVFAPFVGWRGVFAGTGVLAIVAAGAFGRYGRADAERGEPPHFENLGIIMKNRSFWVVSFLLMIAATAAMGMYSVLPTYLVVDHGLEETFVNTLIGGSRVIAFAAILSAGAFADRYGFRRVVLIIMFLTGVATMLIGLTTGATLVISVFLQPAIVGAFFPVAITALTDIVSPRMRNLSVALAIPMANLAGGGIAPTVLSAVGAAGGFSIGFVVLGVLILLSVLTLPLMDQPKR